MSYAKQYAGLSVFLLSAVLYLFLSCTTPSNPYEPSNTKISLALKSPTGIVSADSLIDTVGNTDSLGITANFPDYVDSIGITVYSSPDGNLDIDTMLRKVIALKNKDTLWYKFTFAASGRKTLTATVFAGNFKNPAYAYLTIFDKPVKPVSHTRPHLVVNKTKNITSSQTCSLSVSVQDSNPLQAHVFYVKQDTLPPAQFTPPAFIWTPATGFIGTHQVFFKVIDADDSTYFDTATVLIIVSTVIVAPPQPANIQALVNGMGVFTMTWDNSFADDYIVFRSDSRTGAFAARDTVTGLTFSDTINTLDYYYYVKAHNSADTSVASAIVYTGDLRAGGAPHWTRDTVSLTGPEGATLSMTLSDKCSGDSLSFSIADVPVLNGDTIIGAVYSYTFAVNDTNVYWPRIVAKDKKGNADTMTLHLWASHTSIDSIAPVFKHLNPGIDSIIVNSSSYKVSVICTDNSGIASMKCSMASDTFVTSRSSDSIWSATVTGLAQGQYKTITLLAIDMSARANKASMSLYIKYDSTMADTTGPTFTKISGPSSSSTVTGPAVSFTYTISDPNGVDSVYWALNGNKVGAIVTNASNQYVLSGTLSVTGLNHIIIYAQDKSTRHNKSSEAIDLIYDPTANDKTGPIIKKTGGPANNTKTADPNDTLVYTVTDTSGVDTVYWTLNNVMQGVLSSGTNNQYTIKAVLTVSHANKIVIVASDKSTNHNKSADTTTLNYNKPPSISGAHDTTIQELSTIQFTVTATDPDNDKITLSAPTMPTGATFNATTGAFSWSPTTSQTGANTVVFKANDGLDTTTKSISIVVSNMPPPKITKSPDSLTIKCLGTSASFAVIATGTGLTYQWKNDAGNLSGAHYKGATKDTLTIDTVKAGDAATYTCVVTNAGGSIATSTGAKLTVNAPSSTPTLAANITSVCPPGTVIFTITGTLGTGAQWQVYAGSTKLSTQPTITSNSFTISNISAATSYSVKAEGGACDNASSLPTSNNVAIALTNYNVAFNSNGGTPTPSTQTITCNNTATTPTQAPVKTGYTFVGWYLDTSSSTAFNFSTPIAGAIMLNAKWAIKQYTLTFNITADVPGVIGQISASPAKALYDSNSTVTLTAPTDNNYTFTGWTGGNTGSTNQISVVMNGNKTLAANYTIKKYTLTISTIPASGGGSFTPASGLSYNSGTTVPLTASPNSGYSFVNWTITLGTATLANATNATTATVTLTSGNATATANFGLNAPTITTHPSNKSVILNGTVTFNVVASGISLSYQWQKNGVNITTNANAASYTIPPATVSDNNSTYQCLVTNGGGSVTSNPATLTLQCTITYNGNGGTGNVPQTGTYNYNSFVTVANGGSLALSGFVLWYWNTKSDGTGPTDYALSSGQFQITSNVTLYAKWQVRDIDGNLYDTVHIGTQIWMKQNLKTTKYNNNTTIPQVNGGTGWGALSTPAYCWYGDNINNKDYSGALYNFYAVDTKILAPIGWHVPTDAEFSTLNAYLQSIGSCDQFATFMGGYCTGYAIGSGMEPFLNTAVSGYWWSNSASTQYGLGFQIDYPSFYLNYSSWVNYGYSVRCIMGSP